VDRLLLLPPVKQIFLFWLLQIPMRELLALYRVTAVLEGEEEEEDPIF
jgi:hypothetical protein